MALNDILSKAGRWLKTHKPSGPVGYHQEIDEEGLISQAAESTKSAVEDKPAESNQVLVKMVPPMDKTQSLEKLQESFDKLVEQLEGINSHLNRQSAHNEELMKRLEQLP
jgi:hypothetical protein